MTETERAIAIIEARLPLYTDIGQINALRECISSIRSAALSAGQAQPVAYLVWLQGRRAIDDVEDYYEVARPGDKSVDGSDPFPVYAALVPPAVPGEVERNAIEPGKEELVELLAHFERLGIKNRAAYQKALEDFRAALSAQVPLPEIEGGDKGDGWQECQYAKDMGMSEHRCVVTCVYEEKGFAAAVERAAKVAEGYDDTDTLTAPKAIAIAIRALSVSDPDDLTDCFRHHVRTTIGWQAFGARPGPEMQMYEEGFKAGYRRCKSDNEPELGEEEDGLLAGARRIIRELRDYPDEVAIADAIDLIVDMHKALESRPSLPSASIEGETNV